MRFITARAVYGKAVIALYAKRIGKFFWLQASGNLGIRPRKSRLEDPFQRCCIATF